jgi:hypothetical protein
MRAGMRVTVGTIIGLVASATHSLRFWLSIRILKTRTFGRVTGAGGSI